MPPDIQVYTSQSLDLMRSAGAGEAQVCGGRDAGVLLPGAAAPLQGGHRAPVRGAGGGEGCQAERPAGPAGEAERGGGAPVTSSMDVALMRR